MGPVSPISFEKATQKSKKIHRSRIDISQKVIAFDVLKNLSNSKRSDRELSALLEVPNSTMRSWKDQSNSFESPSGWIDFFSTPDGAQFLQRVVTAVILVIEYGPSGVRGAQEVLRLSGLSKFVASSNGALSDYSKRIEEYIIVFGEKEEERLAAKMRARKITAGLDEMFRRRQPCLVAIEVVSNFILLEKFTEDRKAETWKQEINARVAGLPIEIGQVVSDSCGALTSYAKDIGAGHSPDLFHAQYELAKATAAPLASQERAAQKAVDKAGDKANKAIKKYGGTSEEANRAIRSYSFQIHALEERRQRKEKVRDAKKELGKIYHPVDVRKGKIRTAEEVKREIDTELQSIGGVAKQAGLSQNCMERIAKAGRTFDAMISFLTTFLTMLKSYVEGLGLTEGQKQFFLDFVFPVAYLKMIIKRQGKAEQESLKQLIDSLEAKIRAGPWPSEMIDDWMKNAKELAELFQRSSSCVEGRNGMLSLLHHRCHRLSTNRLKALTVVHNYHIRRIDRSTAAERFFEQKHGNLFEALVENVRIPGKPRNKMEQLLKAQAAA